MFTKEEQVFQSMFPGFGRCLWFDSRNISLVAFGSLGSPEAGGFWLGRLGCVGFSCVRECGQKAKIQDCCGTFRHVLYTISCAIVVCVCTLGEEIPGKWR